MAASTVRERYVRQVRTQFPTNRTYARNFSVAAVETLVGLALTVIGFWMATRIADEGFWTLVGVVKVLPIGIGAIGCLVLGILILLYGIVAMTLVYRERRGTGIDD